MNLSAPSVFIRNAYLAFNQAVLFDNLNLTLVGGKWTCLLGPSGIGKSTLLHLIANLVTPLNQTVIRANVSSDNTISVAQQVAYMAQTDLLLPWLNVLDNVLLGPRLRNNVSPELQEKAIQLLSLTGLAHALKLYPRHLSGGMRQRVALVRTLIEDKPIVLMDEPFSALDAITRFKLQNLAVNLLKNKTVLFITHDPLEALRLADTIYVMSGQPATLSMPIELMSTAPRDPNSLELIERHAALFNELMKANEVSL